MRQMILLHRMKEADEMNFTAWDKLLALLERLIMSRCRTKTEADGMMAQLEEIRREVYRNGE